MKAGVLEGKNLVLAVPTASGKTMVAELCALKHIMERGGKVLYLVPLKALATEKYEEFQKFTKIGIKVILSTGDFDYIDPTLGRHDIIIATNEKADSIFRHRPSWVNALSLIVADEIHLLGDGSRGPTLEALLTGFRLLNPKAQILALSATISNADEIAEWLSSVPITSNWRPVPLLEGVYFQQSVVFKDGQHRKIEGEEKDPVALLAADVIRSGGQMLVFTGSRLSATSLAKRISEPVRKRLKRSEERKLMDLSSKMLRMGERTRISDRLAMAVANGVAFHHAGLTYEQRRAVEGAFRSFLIKCVCATPTLASGVNLPARRVLIYDYRRYEAGVGQTNIPVLEEKQMAGRAGRPKYDSQGEAIMLARSEAERDFLLEEYVLAKPEKVWSKLGAASSLRSHILATITMGLAHSQEDVFDFLEKSFCAYQYGINSFRNAVLESLEMLSSEGMVKSDERKLIPTALGRRVAELYIDPKSAVILRNGLKIRRSGIPPISYLALICHTPDMPKLYVRRRELEALKAFLEANSDLLLYDLPEEEGFECEMLLEEIKTALLLKDWIEESPEDGIVERFDVGSGDIYSYVESAKWLVHAAHELAKLLRCEEALTPLLKLYIRVENGIKEELLPIVSLRGVGRVRARALFSAGFTTIDDLKRASPTELNRIPTIGPETIRSIKEQVGGTVSKAEWSMVKSKRGTKQLSIEDYE
ncbi:MAG: DEAD/DEAH box helicase [Candidatus Verstraetearchaeota archaeon]|nr:DEAD/DEAH box helicase [Candidatus Verstraetearchaeota archaeon]